MDYEDNELHLAIFFFIGVINFHDMIDMTSLLDQINPLIT